MKLRRIIAFVMAIAMTLQVGIYENTTRVDAATSGEAISVFYDTYTDKAMKAKSKVWNCRLCI